MEISKATRTHLIYQFIILTLLFLGNDYEMLPNRKVVLFLAFLPVFCYQVVVFSCCMEFIPIPTWLSFLQPDSEEEKTKKDSVPSSIAEEEKKSLEEIKEITFPEVAEVLPFTRRWEKSVTNLGASPKCFECPQKSKSWMNLHESRSSERLSSREGSLDTLCSLSDRKNSSVQVRNDKIRNREQRAAKAKSWKTGDIDISEKIERAKKTTSSFKERTQLSSNGTNGEQEAELEKSYSFPFRQKRLQTWIDMKESRAEQTNQSPDMPYWQSVGYNLAVKYEARRRQRAISNPPKSDVPKDSPPLRRSMENVPESLDKPNSKKSSKSASACISKLKVGISNLIAKKKEEGTEDSNAHSYKILKPTLFKPRSKATPCQTNEKEQTAMPEFPPFLNNDRPLLFYPKYIPFEKERFESDVKRKIIELSAEQKNSLQF